MGCDNSNLARAKQKKDDEFYTRYADIANELPRYKEQMRGARIICPCDWDESLDEVCVYASEEYVESGQLFSGGKIKVIDTDKTDVAIMRDLDIIKCNFVKFLVAHAEDYGIESISVSGYNPFTGEGVKFQDIDYSKYTLCITNPPFSQFGEFVNTMFDAGIDFLTVAPLLSLTRRDCMKRFNENELRLGYTSRFSAFDKPDGSEQKLGNVCWLTTLEVSVRHDELILTEEYSPERYPRYANFDGIEVGKVADIPYDFDGYMGVPVSILQSLNTDQFELIGSSSDLGQPMKNIAPKGSYVQGGMRFYVPNGDGTYARKSDRVAIRNKKVHHA